MPLDLNFFCQINTLINLYISATALPKYSLYYEVSLENKRLIYNLLFGCPKANFDLDMLKKTYMFKMMLLHPT